MKLGVRSTVVFVSEQSPSDGEVVEQLAEEIPVALVYNGISHAVMMATPADLEDFALGFSLSEGILATSAELHDIDVQRVEEGIAVEMRIATQRLVELNDKRRSLVGRTGCGICGAQSLTQALQPIKSVIAPAVNDAAIQRALTQLNQYQPLQKLTGATHAAAWCNLSGDIVMAREDVGRHNALDKLIGALTTRGENFGDGFVLISSRASYEMVQKTCAVGIGALVAVSAATALAVERAREANQLLIGFARTGRHVIYHLPTIYDQTTIYQQPTTATKNNGEK